ncbi:MAG TPA: flagellar basal body L-ring protein FlgH [Terriglobales bacterium]|nr:flagellar basal body L-ring protein FlgH [Terriglobales bacterium]
MKTVLYCLLLLTADWLSASKRDAQKDNLAKYVARVQLAQPAAPVLTLGSIWVDSGAMASLSADYKARTVGDLITIIVAQGLTSSNANAVSTARTFSANSGITALPGKLKTGGIANLIGLNSSEALSGKGQASTATSVTTNLAGRVVAVLASGNLVVEAERVINMNHEKQTILLRGVVRRGDIGPNNTVASNAVGDLELEIKGKGVISDGVRPPHRVLRAILNFLDF